MSGSRHYDVVVIVGVSSAFWLARRGMIVALLERGSLSGGTSDNSFAWINANA